MRSSQRILLGLHSIAAAVALSIVGSAQAVPQSTEAGAAGAGSAAGTAQPPAATGNFLSSLKQAFKQDLDRDVVRGHFDVGTPPETHRYYCLVDAKTGKSETNGVAGQPVVRPDGMTGIKAGAVSFYNCATAEQQGNLVTAGYTLSPAIRAKVAQASPSPTATVPSSAAPSVAAAPSSGAAPPAAPAAVGAMSTPTMARDSDLPSGTGALQTDIMAAYTRFVAGQNAHDRTAVSDVLLDSRDFVWTQAGDQLWGHQQAMDAFQARWKGTWTLDPQLNEARIASVSPNVALLTTPLLFTRGDPGQKPSTSPVRWSGIFVKTSSGWHISSIFLTPLDNWHAPGGS